MDVISFEQEVPLVELPADPAFRENFCFEGYDHDRDIGYFIHIGRWSLDPRYWREQVQIYMPDGDYLVRRSWGQGDISKGPSAALLKLTCEEPGKRWNIRYRGPARRTTAAELLDGPLGERPQILMDLDVTFESTHDIWEMGHSMDNQMWGSWHIEQPGTVRGRFETGGKVTEMDGVGYRDHSRGPRKLTALFDECWVHALFPSGRAFAVFHIRQKPADDPAVPALAEAVIWDENGKLYPATCKVPPLLGGSDHPLTAPPTRFTIDLESEIGPMHIEAEVKRALPHSTTEHGEWLDGIVISNPTLAHLVTYERPTVFTWNGELGGGHTEQARRLR